ncbi:hypothetical protein FOXG_14687 [Fusarium oxysporum f. sp. lycopersici 4287]|uniref:Uncharacterized protein n=2 Tax=Fusarium oxysporum TaxID=5507 RepID=A0A0J9WTL7_FUSO4|nr:hypothetical protein FOXG_14687 [Fusarium oxysporum f. sp. lycopersici 4287]KNB16252.1 hypothetical protein FOXG_14687 [Fusarium oxysporum f. sp. lycopersici 4287]
MAGQVTWCTYINGTENHPPVATVYVGDAVQDPTFVRGTWPDSPTARCRCHPVDNVTFFVTETRHNNRRQRNNRCTSSDSSRCSLPNVSIKQRPIVNAAAGKNSKQSTLLKGFG